MSNKHKVIVYGTLRPGDESSEKVMIPGQIYDIGWFPGLVFNEGGPDSFVVGEIIEVDDEKLSQLDSYEGYYEDDPQGSLYLRKKLWDCWVYVYNRKIEDTQTLVEGGDWLAYRKEKEGASARLGKPNNGKPEQEIVERSV